MKMILILITLMVSAVAQAFPEVECDGVSGTKRVRVEVDRGFGGGGTRSARVVISENNEYVTHPSFVNWRPQGGRAQYYGAAFNLMVDFWPDRAPQWGRSYRGDFISPLFENSRVSLYCRYNNFR